MQSDFAKRAAKDLHDGKKELLAELRKMPVSELYRLPPDTLTRLSSEDLRTVFAPRREQLLKVINVAPTSSTSWIRKGSKLWYLFPWPVRSQLTGITASLLLLGSAAALEQQRGWVSELWQVPLPQNATLWPACARLTPDTDGCVYFPDTDLSWEQAALQLGLTIATLQASNQHLNPNQPLHPNNLLIIWRGKLTLQETNS